LEELAAGIVDEKRKLRVKLSHRRRRESHQEKLAGDYSNGYRDQNEKWCPGTTYKKHENSKPCSERAGK
jgi:hypothetical protein